MQPITIGRIVEYHPNGTKEGLRLPNSMNSAPAIVTQIFDAHINLNAFTSEPDASLNPVKVAWSIQHKADAPKSEVEGETDKVAEGFPYWDWLPRV